MLLSCMVELGPGAKQNQLKAAEAKEENAGGGTIGISPSGVQSICGPISETEGGTRNVEVFEANVTLEDVLILRNF